MAEQKSVPPRFWRKCRYRTRGTRPRYDKSDMQSRFSFSRYICRLEPQGLSGSLCREAKCPHLGREDVP